MMDLPARFSSTLMGLYHPLLLKTHNKETIQLTITTNMNSEVSTMSDPATSLDSNVFNCLCKLSPSCSHGSSHDIMMTHSCLLRAICCALRHHSLLTNNNETVNSTAKPDRHLGSKWNVPLSVNL
jgi:hypothetical protein